MDETIVLNLDKVRQGVAVGEGELLHKAQMDTLLDKIRLIMSSVPDFRRQFTNGQRAALSHRRHHDAILLSGARGTGKTTFLLSALHKLQHTRLSVPRPDNLIEECSFCVFEPIDPTLFGCNEHILLTLLSMIAERVRHEHGQQDMASGWAGETDALLDAWERKLKALAKGLRTVGEQREDISGDPEPPKDVWDDAEFMLEQGMDSARSSYELEYKLHDFIHTSLTLLHKDAFVLGLDDVDTRPGVGWHVLETLRRYLTTPQLIVIVSGNMELFQKLVERRQLKNFGLDFSSSPEVQRAFSPQVTELTHQYLLKVLRTPMRIDLLPFYEVLEQGNRPDGHYSIALFGAETPLSDVLDKFYEGLACRDNSGLKAVFRKALFANSTRTILQIAEQLIALRNNRGNATDKAWQRRQVADILRIALFEFLAASGVAQPQEFFEQLREGVGIEEITRLLLAGKLPGDASLVPVHNELRVNNSLLVLTAALSAAASGNASVFFVYFFKVCLASHVLEGQDGDDISTVLGQATLNGGACHCSSLLFGDARRSGWRAPGIISIYGASVGKNIPQRVRMIYGDKIESLLKKESAQTIHWAKELQPFMAKVCDDEPVPYILGYIMTTYESLQSDIHSWHRELLSHGFYEVMHPEGNYRFFSVWELLGLVTQLLVCATEEDAFDTLFRKSRMMTVRHGGLLYKMGAEDQYSRFDNEFESENINSEFDQDDPLRMGMQRFMKAIMAWKNAHTEHPIVHFTPTILCMRIFNRFLQGMERLNGINAGEIFLGNFIHRSLVILFNSLLIEEHVVYRGNAEGLNLTTPLSSDDIFIRNIEYISGERLNADNSDTSLWALADYPLTQLIMSCPLWLFYVRPEQKSRSVAALLNGFSSRYGFVLFPAEADEMVIDSRDTAIHYGSRGVTFDNFYYLLNAMAIPRKIEVALPTARLASPEDPRTGLGLKYDMPTGKRRTNLAPKIITAIEAEDELREEFGENMKSLDNADVKRLLQNFYTTIPSSWLSQRSLRELRKILIEESGMLS